MTRAQLIAGVGSLAVGGVGEVLQAGEKVGSLPAAAVMGVGLVVLGVALWRVYQDSRKDRTDAAARERAFVAAIADQATKSAAATEAFRAQASVLGKVVDAVRSCPGGAQVGRRWGDEEEGGRRKAEGGRLKGEGGRG